MSDFGTDLLENNLEKPSEDTLETITSKNFDESSSINVSEDLTYNSSLENSDSDFKINSTDEISIDDTSSQNSNDEHPTDENTAPDVNCLYLTVKKDYSLSIVKNKIKRAVKGSWKVAVSIFVLNFLSSFF